MSDTSRLRRGAIVGTSAGALAMLISTVNAADTGIIAEVLVTAQKRTENVQDVPTSVSVFSDERLEQLHSASLIDFATYMPGVNVSSGGSPGQTTVTLRGIAPVGPGAVVGTYVDDTPLGSSSNYARAIEFGLDLMPYDVERVEVLRGPQGTLYGAGSMGGLLKYVLRDPDTQDFEFRAGVEGFDTQNAEDVGWGARAAVNVPLGETIALRASAFNQETPGYIDNPSTGENGENDLSQKGGRLAFLWRPSDTFSVKLGGMWQRLDSDDNGSMQLALTGVDPPTGTPIGDLQHPHVLPQTFEKSVDYYSATINWSLGFADFVSATSYSDTHTLQVVDATEIFGTLYPLLTGGAIPAGQNNFSLTLDLEKWTQEFRLESGSEGALEWLVGAFYTEEKSANIQESVALDASGQPIAAFSPFFAFAQLPTNYEEIAVFGDLTYKFTDAFDVTAGLRYAENDQTFRQISGGVVVPTANQPGASSEDVLTYMLTPRFHLSDDTMLYLRVASGYRPGGPNVVVPGVPPQVQADELVNYEVGLKTQFLEHRALINVAVFRIDWTDIQQVQAFGGVSGLDNAGDAKSQGVEFESVFSPASSVRLGLNVAYTDATLEDSPPALDNKLGAPLPNVPEWSGSLTADFDFQIAGRDTHVGGGYRYVGEQESSTVTNTDNLSYVRPSYDSVDLNADMSFDSMTVRVYAKNVTDERAYTGGTAVVNGLNIPVFIDVNVLQPRTFGVSLDFRF